MGTAFALGKETWRNMKDTSESDFAESSAIKAALAGYETIPPWADPYEWEMEAETVATLLSAYMWYYSEDDVTFLAVEHAFEMPLLNPATGKPSRTFSQAGKLDGICQLADGRQAVNEDKLTGSDTTPGSEYWQRLRFDGQISQYVAGARHLGYDISTVLYDTVRKPTIRPTLVPILDDDGLKIVQDMDGTRIFKKNGDPRQSALAEKGWIVHTRPMKAAEWSAKLMADIEAKPEWYFVRQEIPRLDSDMLEFQAEIWQQAQLLRECRNNNWWFRNVAYNTCKYCDYAGPCLSGVDVNLELPPQGFVVVEDENEELGI
jgi:hypothetical protein